MRVTLGVLGGEKDAGQAALRVGRSTSLLPLGPVTPGERERSHSLGGLVGKQSQGSVRLRKRRGREQWLKSSRIGDLLPIESH